MSVIATIEIGAEDFAPGGVLAGDADVRVRVERVVPVGSRVIPYFWARDDDLRDIKDALRAATDVEAFSVVDTVDGEALFRVEWAEDADGFLDAIAKTGGTILEAEGGSDAWTLRLRFATHDGLTDFYRRCADRGISVDLRSVHDSWSTGEAEREVSLTDTQRETLLSAFDNGYFEVPRRTNLVELADDLGVSDTAVSQRLRRGIASILGETIVRQGEGSESESDAGSTVDGSAGDG